MILPDASTLPQQPRRIVLHWTAGTDVATNNDRKHYHFLIDQEGRIVKGFPEISSNCVARIQTSPWDPGNPKGYAAHTARYNTGSIGVSLCGMHGAIEGGNPGRYPINKLQGEELIGFVSRLCVQYGLWPTVHRVMTHEEVQRIHGVEQSGKWDIRWLPTDKGIITGDSVGVYLRAKISEAMPS